jgi:phosphate:Na+ symporter
MALAVQHVIPPAAALALVLGANLGNVIPQYLAAADNADARRLALGNLIMRGTACLVIAPNISTIADLLTRLEGDPARQIADFHTLFNLAVAVVFIWLLDPLAKLCVRIIPSKPAPIDPKCPVYLDRGALKVPNLALADAARETLRLVDLIEEMLSDFLSALKRDDRKILSRISRTDDKVDALFGSIKLYLAEMGRAGQLNDNDAARCADILGFATNLEHAGDILEKSLREIAAKKIRRGLSFSTEGFGEIADMHARLIAALRLATAVFVSGDAMAARNLILEKERMRGLERMANENHFRRLREGRQESIETSALHCDIARDLKRIASHIAAIAQSPLERNGMLLQSRLTG